MSRLRAGLVGLGMMGRHHARVLNNLEGVELVGVADPQGDKHGAAVGVEALKSHEELIGKHPDYVVIATPTATHHELGEFFASKGIHVLIEKPLADDVADGEELLKIFDAAGVIGAVGHIERYNPALQQLRWKLEAGELGEIHQVSTRRQGPFPARIADVGVVKDLATHDVDLTMWITGSEYRHLAAHTSFKSGRQHEDLVAITGLLNNNAVANHLVNWLSPFKERVTVVSGERGAFVADTLSADLTFYGNGIYETQWDAVANFRGVTEGDVVRFSFPKVEPLISEHIAMRDAVSGMRDSGIVTLKEALKNVEVASAILAAANTGQTINL